MMRVKLTVIFLVFTTTFFGQQLQMQFGSSISSLDWNYKAADFDMGYDQAMVGKSVLIGVNYLNYKYFDLTSNVGLLNKGGRVGNYNPTKGLYREVEDVSNPNLYSELYYMTVNTLVEFKYPLHKTLTSVISVGPRIDYLLQSKGEIQAIDEVGELNNIVGGFIVGGGFRYAISNMIVGIRSDFYFNHKSVADWPVESSNMGGEINDDTVTVNLTFAYNISRDAKKKTYRSMCDKQW